MYLKIDNKLVKYLIILLLVYYCANKVPIGTLPITNPVHFTMAIGIVLYLLDKPMSISEGFDEQIIENRVKEYNTSPVSSITNASADSIYTINEKTAEVATINTPSEPTIINTPSKDDKDMMKTGLPVIDKVISDAEKDVPSCDCKEVANKAIVKFLQNRRLLDKNGMLHYADAFIGDMGYSDIKLDQYIPIGAPGNGAYDTWELADFNMLNTDRWKPPLKNTRECKMGTLPQPQPLNKNVPLSLNNFDYSRTILPPQNINVDYINDKLNKQQ